MKQSSECPKCHGMNIWNNTHVATKVIPSRRWLLVNPSNWPQKRKFAFKDEYVCLDCGYSETYLDSEGIETIKKYGYPEDR
ncbi:MAG: hypothetical protein ACFFF4_05200 [Candidatus Thorarchaeota archaeon]